MVFSGVFVGLTPPFLMGSMPMTRAALLLAASLVFITSAQTADEPKQGPADLERKLHGEWKGGPCEGDWTFAPDGTYKVQHDSPGNNKLTGAWEVWWNALPPTLVLTCKTSDDPDHIKVGGKAEVKLIQLDDDALAYQYLSQYQQPGGHTDRFKRVKK
jgi:hypothetical protein